LADVKQGNVAETLRNEVDGRTVAVHTGRQMVPLEETRTYCAQACNFAVRGKKIMHIAFRHVVALAALALSSSAFAAEQVGQTCSRIRRTGELRNPTAAEAKQLNGPACRPTSRCRERA
jgi:hypothetical protein